MQLLAKGSLTFRFSLRLLVTATSSPPVPLQLTANNRLGAPDLLRDRFLRQPLLLQRMGGCGARRDLRQKRFR
jgi:hypothetical protein